MSLGRLLPAALVALAALAWADPAAAQVAPCPEPSRLPPAGSPPLYRCVQFVFHPVDQPVVEPMTYAATLRAPWSQPGQDQWVPYDEDAILADYWNVWRLGFLEDLWIEVIDEPYANGVGGKHVVFHAEERSRVKIVDYLPADPDQKLVVEISKIESTLREQGITVRLDSFVDETIIRQVAGVIRELYAQQGFNDPTVTTRRTDIAGGPKLINLTFVIDPGPKVRIREVVFDGNEAFSDGKLRGQMKENKQQTWMSFLSGAGIYKEQLFADDAERVSEFYKERGYAGANIGQPTVEVIETSIDGEERWIRVRVPVDEGPRYQVGKFEITGESTLNLEAVRDLFKIKEGDFYSSKKLREGLDKARDAYGQYGFWQWSFDPDLSPRGIDPATGQPIGPEPPEPIMDITIKMNEGKQFLVNRITFRGNTTTHDAVIRRELRIAENGVFNTAALKDSVRRLNQLGYFKPLEGAEGEMEVVPTPGVEGKVDVTLRVEEENRNQITFGAGVSQFDGFFGQLAFQTANFLGRGETVGLSLQRGSQASQYQLSFSEPYLFERAITVGADVYSRQFVYPLQFTQRSAGGNFVVGVPLRDYTRLFMGYSYEEVRVSDLNEAYLAPEVRNSSPFLRDSLLLDQNGRRTVSKITPRLIFNTVDHPVFPSQGTRYSVGVDLAGLGGNTSFVQSSLEGIWYRRFTPRTSLGLRAQGLYIRPYGSTTSLPIFEKLFSGGEYTIRGFDIRSVGPRDPITGVLTGGNKMLTFNAEYYFSIMSQARIVFFYDAGQVQDVGQRFTWREPVYQVVTPERLPLADPFVLRNMLTAVGGLRAEVVGQTSAFKTSTGVELRFFLPVLNVPFRLIAAYNPQRLGVIDNEGRQTDRFKLRVAVGTTF